MTDKITTNPVSWKRLLIFFIIATAVSNLFRFDVFNIHPAIQKLPTWLSIFVFALLHPSGVLLATFIVMPFLRKERRVEMSLFGTSKQKSLLMCAIPIVLLTAIGVNNDYKLENHIYAFVAIIGTIVYCIEEEYGWRGYLQEELKGLKPWAKYLIIGCLWYVWHLSFVHDRSIVHNLTFLSLLIFGSWGIGKIAETTKSVLASACFHLIVQIMMLNSLFRHSPDKTTKFVIFVVCVGAWFMIFFKWNKTRNTSN